MTPVIALVNDSIVPVYEILMEESHSETHIFSFPSPIENLDDVVVLDSFLRVATMASYVKENEDSPVEFVSIALVYENDNPIDNQEPYVIRGRILKTNGPLCIEETFSCSSEDMRFLQLVPDYWNKVHQFEETAPKVETKEESPKE